MRNFAGHQAGNGRRVALNPIDSSFEFQQPEPRTASFFFYHLLYLSITFPQVCQSMSEGFSTYALSTCPFAHFSELHRRGRVPAADSAERPRPTTSTTSRRSS